ncbi:MAG: hypothetical protein E4G99_02355 [Anaerolineales bacterium]|nr:MAG: hypothetical protein E4G99_02355 [Anaerolineales bacterium]
MPSIDLQVLAPVPIHFVQCMHCEQFFQQAGIGAQVHRSELEQYPEDFIQDAENLAGWLFDLAQRESDRIRIRVIDAQSIQGFLLSIRHWVRGYPAFIVNRRKAYIGWDREVLDRILQACSVGFQELSESI